MQPPDDDVLVSKVLDGDTEQFSELVRRYQVRLYRYAVSMVGSGGSKLVIFVVRADHHATDGICLWQD